MQSLIFEKTFFLRAWRYNKIIKILKVLYVNLCVKSFRVSHKTNSRTRKIISICWEFEKGLNLPQYTLQTTYTKITARGQDFIFNIINKIKFLS